MDRNMGDLVIGAIMTLVVVYAMSQMGLVIGDRFTTSDALAIDNATNPDGYTAQQNLNTGFYDNMDFASLLIFIVIVAVAIYILRGSFASGV